MKERMTKRTFNCECNKVLKDGKGERCGACEGRQSGTMERALAITPYERACFIIRAFGNKSLEPHFNTIRNHVDKLTQEKAEMERALELAVESTVLRHECNSSRMTLCKRGGDYEQCLKCWQDYFISKAQQEEGKCTK